MKNIIKTLLFLIIVSGCNNLSDKQNKSNSFNNHNDIVSDTTPKVIGIGGIFFKSANPKKTTEWYGKNLGLAIDNYGSAFEFRNANNPNDINYLRWSVFDDKTNYFKPSDKDFMINYRVSNIEALEKKLKANGVTIVDTIIKYDYGKFLHILDDDGNKIELWEPIDSFFTELGGSTTK